MSREGFTEAGLELSVGGGQRGGSKACSGLPHDRDSHKPYYGIFDFLGEKYQNRQTGI